MNSKIILLLGGILASLVVFLCLKDQYTKPKVVTKKVIKPVIPLQVDKNITNIEHNKTKILVKVEDNKSETKKVLDKNISKEKKLIKKVEKAPTVKVKKELKSVDTKSIQKHISKTLSKKPIYFKFGSSQLTANSKQTLKSIAKMLDKSGYKYTLSIEGHTDAKGNENYNKILSKKRATSVQNYLKKYCKNIKEISAVGYGSSKPKVKNPKSKKNRRVEIIIKRGEKWWSYFHTRYFTL